MNFREILRKLRIEKKLKISQLAKKADVSVSYLSMIENGLLKNDPSKEIIQKLESTLGVSEGTLSSYAVTGNQSILREICANPKSADKMNLFMVEVVKHPEILDKAITLIKKEKS